MCNEEEQPATTVHPAPAKGVGLALSATPTARSYFSSWYLRTARRMADQAHSIENSSGDWPSDGMEILELVTTAVIQSSTFLEAMINELFADAYDQHGLSGVGYLAPLDTKAIRLMATYWGESGGRDRTLAKYQLALSFADAPLLDIGCEPYQSADLLRKLRNRLIHYRPESIRPDTVAPLERALTRKYPSSRLDTKGSWWPNRALSGGCARWACDSAHALADEFSSRMGIRPNYQRVMDRI